MASPAGEDEVLASRWCRWAKEWVPVFGITALAAGLRVLALGEIPPGLYHDEAFNGLDALRVLTGQWPIYFAANHGREPLFIYLIAATVGLLGRTPGALRLAAAACGTLTIPATYLMARAWFNRRIGLLSATIMTITLWHVHLSRIGFRAVTLPLTTSVALWLGARAYRSHRRRDWFLAGLLYGICFYAYLPARFTPVALAAFALYLLCTGRGSRLWPGAVWFAAGAAATLAPLAIHAAGHWDVVMGRPGQVSILDPHVNEGDLWGTLGRQLAGTLGMFFVRGDTIPRHNLPGRSVFDPLMGIAMAWGLVQAALHARRKSGTAFALIWVGLMLVPTWLAEDAPHFLRAVGVLPTLAALPALGIDAAMTWLEQRRRRGWAIALTCAALAGSLTTTAWDYFARYGTDPQTAYAFESAAAELAAEANRFTGTGWDGSGLTAQEGDPVAGHQVYVDGRLWDEWEAIPFLVPESDSVTVISAEMGSSSDERGPGEATLLLVWPYAGLGRYHDLLPGNARIEAHGGALARGDLEDAPYEAYVAYAAEPRGERPATYLVRFGNRHSGDQIALVDYAVEADGRRWRVQLEWEALVGPVENYTVFVHLRDGDSEGVVVQDDGMPAEDHFPTGLWRSGDVVVDVHTLELPEGWAGEPRIVVGLYLPLTQERLEAVSNSGESLGDEFVLAIK